MAKNKKQQPITPVVELTPEQKLEREVTYLHNDVTRGRSYIVEYLRSSLETMRDSINSLEREINYNVRNQSKVENFFDENVYVPELSRLPDEVHNKLGWGLANAGSNISNAARQVVEILRSEEKLKFMIKSVVGVKEIVERLENQRVQNEKDHIQKTKQLAEERMIAEQDKLYFEDLEHFLLELEQK